MESEREREVEGKKRFDASFMVSLLFLLDSSLSLSIFVLFFLFLSLSSFSRTIPANERVQTLRKGFLENWRRENEDGQV